MKLRCLEEHRITQPDGGEVRFEETRLSGAVYEVEEAVGQKLLKTRKFEVIPEPEEEVVPG